MSDTAELVRYPFSSALRRQAIKYLILVKPERTLTNVITAAAGFLFASRWRGNWRTMLALLVGSTFIIASACVFNNLLDRKMDQKMDRTKKRALVRGEVSPVSATVYAVILGIVGFGALVFTNWLTFIIGVVAFIGYVVLYDLAKRYTVHSTLIGTLPGGASLVAGYTAAVGHLGVTAWLLFLVMAAWQMAHFYAISIFRHKDYAAAGLPVMSVKYGIKAAKVQTIIYIAIFTVTAILLGVFGKAGIIYEVVAVLVGVYWLGRSLGSYKRLKNELWARDVFKISLSVLVILMATIAASPLF